MEHQVKEVKIVQHCIQLTIAKSENISKENISKTAVTFLVFDSMYVCLQLLYYINLVNFVFVYISQINLSDSSATQWVFNLKSQSRSWIKLGILM